MYQVIYTSKKIRRSYAWWFFLAFLVGVYAFPANIMAKKTPAKAEPGMQKASQSLSWGWINVSGSHVRQAPDANSYSLDVLKRHQLVLVLGKKEKWTKVQYEQGKEGWIFTKNLAFGFPKKVGNADRILLVCEEEREGRKIITIYFNGRINQKAAVFKMENPPRLVVDIKDLRCGRNKSFVIEKSKLISDVRLGIHPKMTRLVLTFKKKVKHFSSDPLQNGIGLKLTMSFGSAYKSPAGLASPAKAKKRAVVQRKTRKKAKTIVVTKTGFKDEKTRSIILLSVSSTPTYYVKFNKKKVGLILNDAQIDKRYLRFFDTSAFPTPLKKVEFKNVTSPTGEKRAEVWVTSSRLMQYDVKSSKGRLEWIFTKPKEFVAKSENTVKKKATRTARKQPETKGKAVTVKKGGAKEPKIAKGESPQYLKKPKYTGAKMTFDFQNADIHNVLRLIAEVSNLNIVAGDDVRGKITLRLKNVPWDQALDIILESKGLGKEMIGNVLRIAPKAKLKKEMQERIASKKVIEKLEKRVTQYIPVNYTTAKDLSVKIKPMLSPRGTVTVDERTNMLIVKDIPKKIEDVKNLVKQLDTPTPEVLIESRIVEAAKEFTREVGIKWGMLYNRDPMHGNPLSGDFPNSLNMRGDSSAAPTGGGLLPNVNLPSAGGVYGALGITLEQVVDIFSLDVELTAMEDNGLGKVISSPRIATLDNKPARIEQGLRIPYLKITEEGTVTTEFIEANLNLEVTPHVSNDKMINMDIKVSKDTPDWTHLVQGVPSIDKKEATTNVMVKDGGVTAIGGIFTIEKTNVVHKVPLFGDIPILGWAFKNKRTVRNRKELLIFISPKLIPLKR